MNYSKEQKEQMREALIKIRDYCKGVYLNEPTTIEDPWDRHEWSFTFKGDFTYQDFERVSNGCYVVLEKSHNLGSTIGRVLEKDEINTYQNEIMWLIKEWTYIKSELEKESEKQLEKEQEATKILNNFHI